VPVTALTHFMAASDADGHRYRPPVLPQALSPMICAPLTVRERHGQIENPSQQVSSSTAGAGPTSGIGCGPPGLIPTYAL
jgi:hypothetical protein